MSPHRSAAVLAVLFAAGLPLPVDAAKHTLTWHVGHRNLDYFEEAAAGFKKAVEEGSGGELEVRIVTADDDASLDETAPTIAEKVARGEIQMGHSYTDVLGALEPRLHLFEAPYLFRGYRHLEGVFEGPLGAGLLDALRAKGLVGLSFTYSGGASGVATDGRELRGPRDLEGLKVGIFGDAVERAWLSRLGAVPVPLGHDLRKIAPMVREGDLDAVVITWRNLQVEELERVFTRFNLAGSTYLVSMTYINAEFLESLPEGQRALIKREALKAGAVERAKTILLNESAKRELSSKGVRPVRLSAASREGFLRALEPAYRDAIDPLLGEGWLRRIRDAEDAGHPSAPAAAAGR